MTRNNLQKLEGMEHPAYNPGLALSAYDLFWSIDHFLNSWHFNNEEEVKTPRPMNRL